MAINYNIVDKSERVQEYVDLCDMTYEWFCPNSWTMEDVAINFAMAIEEGHQDDMLSEINLMSNWLKGEAIDACSTAIINRAKEGRTDLIINLAQVINYLNA